MLGKIKKHKLFLFRIEKNTTINLEKVYQNLSEIINDYSKVLKLLEADSKDSFKKYFSLKYKSKVTLHTL